MKQSPAPMQLTRIFCATLLALPVVASAQPSEAVPEKTKPITLQEALQFALENNLDVKIQRFGPEIARFNLSGSYSVYEPQLNLSAIHTYSSRPGGVDEFGRPIGSQVVETDAYDGVVAPGISGLFPTGLQYRLDAGVRHNEVSGLNRLSEDYSGTWGVNLEQPLLRDFWIDSGRAQILLGKKDVKISQSVLLAQIQQTVHDVEQAYYNLIFARENVKVLEKALELADRTLVENRKRVEVGALAPLDEKEAESQVATSRADLLAAQRSLAIQENVLKRLITDNYAEWHAIRLLPAENLIAVPATYDLQDSWRKGLTMRPDIQQVKLDLERRDITLKFQKNQLLPALDLVGGYGHNSVNTSYNRALDDLTRDNNPDYSYGVRFSVPLGNIGARNRYKASKAEKERALLQYKQIEEQVMIQIDDAIKQAQTSFQRVEATRQARLFSEAALDAVQKKLENGKTTSFFVLQSQRDLTAARFEEIRALAEYNNALAQLALREGTTLQRHKLEVNLKD